MPSVELVPLSDYALRDAYDRLYAVYREAFPGHRVWNFEREDAFREIVSRCKLQRSTRHFLKGIVEALELKRHGLETS